MQEIMSFHGQIDLVRGMYGKEHVFTSGSPRVQKALERYLVRILTEEDVFHLARFGALAPLPFQGRVHQSILSGLRLCRHDTRAKLVVDLKAIGKLDQDFPALDQRFPVPGTMSFTTLDRWAAVYRVCVDRHADTFFPTANTNCLVIDVAGIGCENFRHFSDPVEVQSLLSELELLLPGFAMMEKWKEEIQECVVTLAESHFYCEVHVEVMMKDGRACLLRMGQLPGHIQFELSYAAYVKQQEKRGKCMCSASSHGHSHILYKALLQGIEAVAPIGETPMNEWELIRRILRMGVLFQMECSIWQQVNKQPRSGARGKYLLFAGMFRAACWLFGKKIGIVLLAAAPFLIRIVICAIHYKPLYRCMRF